MKEYYLKILYNDDLNSIVEFLKDCLNNDKVTIDKRGNIVKGDEIVGDLRYFRDNEGNRKAEIQIEKVKNYKYIKLPT